jgi:hypothetical protein
MMFSKPRAFTSFPAALLLLILFRSGRCEFRSEQFRTASHAPNSYSHRMNDGIQLLAVELDGSDGLMVTFSDGTTCGYVVEELVGLRPIRERINIKKIEQPPMAKVKHENLKGEPY